MMMSDSLAFMSRDVWCVLGLPFDRVTLEEAASQVGDVIDNKTPCFLSTPNLNFVIAATTDEQFFQSVLDSDLSVADGMPIICVAKLLGVPLRERVAGSSLFSMLSDRPRKNKIRVFFFGGQKGVAETANNILNSTSHGMESCGFYDPGFVPLDEMSSQDIIDTISNASPDFLVVALGAKKGQAWIQRNRGVLDALIVSHLGAVINFVAGAVERAPEAWQKFGLEWVWRIKQEPGLWRRYVIDGLRFLTLLVINIFPLAVHNTVVKKLPYYAVEPKIIHKDGEITLLELSGSFKDGALSELKSRLSSILDDFNKDVVMSCVNLEYIDSACIATLLLFQSELIKRKRKLYLEHLPWRIKLILRLNNVSKRFFYLKK